MKIIFQKIICAFLCVCFFSGCNKQIIDNGDEYLSKLKIEDFVIKVSKDKEYEKDAYFLTIENYSKFNIIDPIINYSIKKDKYIKASMIFESYINEHAFLFEGDRTPADILLIANSKEVVKSNSRSSDVLIAVGTNVGHWNDIPTDEQFLAMEKCLLEFKLIGENNEMYLVKYNYLINKWTIELVEENVDSWKSKRILKNFPIPSVNYNLLNTHNMNTIEFLSYDVSKDYFSKYVDVLKKIGYDKFAPIGTNADYYGAANSNGNQVYIKYNAETKTMYVKLKNKI